MLGLDKMILDSKMNYGSQLVKIPPITDLDSKFSITKENYSTLVTAELKIKLGKFKFIFFYFIIYLNLYRRGIGIIFSDFTNI